MRAYACVYVREAEKEREGGAHSWCTSRWCFERFRNFVVYILQHGKWDFVRACTCPDRRVVPSRGGAGKSGAAHGIDWQRTCAKVYTHSGALVWRRVYAYTSLEPHWRARKIDGSPPPSLPLFTTVRAARVARLYAEGSMDGGKRERLPGV